MFRYYDGIVSDIRRQLKHEGFKLTPDNLPGYLADVVRQIVSRTKSQLGAHQDTILCLFEAVHYLLSHRVVYVHTDFARKMIDADLKFRIDNLKIPHSLFELCFDDKFEIEPGLKMESSLIIARPDDSVLSAVGNFVHRYVAPDFPLSEDGKFPAQIVYQRFGHKDEDFVASTLGNLFSIRFRSHDQSICHACIPCDDSEGRNASAVIDELGDFKYSKVGIEPVDQTDKKVQKAILKVALGVLAYWNTTDPDIESIKPKDRPRLGASPTCWFVGRKVVTEKWFIRSGGPMVLGHKRYRRDSEGRVRIIWRKAAEVNAHAKPSMPKPKVEEVTDDVRELSGNERK